MQIHPEDKGSRKKRVNGGVLGPKHPPGYSKTHGEILVLDLITEKDGRLHLLVSVLAKNCYGLMDCGATVSVIGFSGWQKLKHLINSKLNIQKSKYSKVRVANGALCSVEGSVMLPVTIDGEEKSWEFIIVPNLQHELILGIDFLKSFGLVVDFGNASCSMSNRELPVISEIITSHEKLSEKQKLELHGLVEKYKPTLGRPELGCTHLVTHKIDTGDAEPVRQRYYSYSPKLLEVLHSGLEEWLEKDVVEASNSPWASGILLIKKPDKSYRWVVDLRNVNKVTKKDSYPLPKVADILDQLRDARFISSIDLASAYFQIPLEESSKEKTAFIVPGKGLFQFKRMPQGLHTSPATWQRFIDKVLGEDLKPYVFVYLDDIIIVSQTFESHLILLNKVLSRLEKAGLTINLDKSKFCRSELKYLGFVVNEKGLQVDPEKVAAISSYKRPKTRKQLKRFIGMASWYRKFVPAFSSIMAPLHALTSLKNAFKWSPECEFAFESIKEKLISAPVLACPDFSKPFDLYCDASGVGIGAILSQEGKVVAYASRSLTDGEKKYFPTELECLAVLWAIEKFRGYLEGYHFNVITDHASLLWLNNLKDPCGRLGRWAVRLQQYDYNVIHRKGKEHEAPDALSRNPLPFEGASIDCMDCVDLDLISVENENDIKDNWYQNLKDQIIREPDKYPNWKVNGTQIFKRVSLGLRDPRWVKVIPKNLRKTVLDECHDSPLAGHFGVHKTYHRVRQSYYWPRMRFDIKQYINSCRVCTQFKVPQVKPAGLMGEQKKIFAPFQVISTDLMGPFPRSSSGYMYLAVVTDLFSKYVWMRPLRVAKAPQMKAHLLEDVFLKFGVPGTIICDNGTQYKSKLIKDFCAEYGVNLLYNFYYHAQANPTERVNRVVKTCIASYLKPEVKKGHRKWDENLHFIANAINTSIHEVTGFTPHEIIFGEEWKGHGSLSGLHIPDNYLPDFNRSATISSKQLSDIRQEVIRKLSAAYQKNAKYYNLRRRPCEFSIGQEVYRKTHDQSKKVDYFTKKLAPKFVGPFKIKKKVGNRGYLLENEFGIEDGPWHAEALKSTNKIDSISEVSVSVEKEFCNIVSWNVASARAVLRKGNWNEVLQTNPDIVALQETRCPKDKIPVEFWNSGFPFCYWSPNSSLKSSGVAVLSKIQPLDVKFGIDNEYLDRIVTLKFQFCTLVNLYSPYCGVQFQNISLRMAWEKKLYNYVKELSQDSSLIICGDFNVAFSEIDVHPLEINPMVAGFSFIEKNCFKNLLSIGLIDTFRALQPAVYKYTFWSYAEKKRERDEGWRLDYFLASKSILNSVVSSNMFSDIGGSDHCPIFLRFIL